MGMKGYVYVRRFPRRENGKYIAIPLDEILTSLGLTADQVLTRADALNGEDLYYTVDQKADGTFAIAEHPKRYSYTHPTWGAQFVPA